jgi:hypothetical protein
MYPFGSGGGHHQGSIFNRSDRTRENILNRDQALDKWAVLRDAIQKIYNQKAS